MKKILFLFFVLLTGCSGIPIEKYRSYSSGILYTVKVYDDYGQLQRVYRDIQYWTNAEIGTKIHLVTNTGDVYTISSGGYTAEVQ